MKTPREQLLELLADIIVGYVLNEKKVYPVETKAPRQYKKKTKAS